MAEAPKRTKRIVKNPETFREKSIKASVANDKPGVAKRIKSRSGKLTNPIWKPVNGFFIKINKVQPFKFIFKLFRLLGLIIAPKYVRTSWIELKQVTWPNRLKSRQLTSAVLIFAIVFGTAVALVDYGLDKLFRHILLK